MMHEFTPLVRESAFRDVEKFYVLAYEGEVTEKKYFSSLRKSPYFNDSGKVEIYPLARKKNEGTAPTYVKARLNEAKRNYRFRPTDEFWLVIDRDHWEGNQHIDIREVYASCAKEKLTISDKRRTTESKNNYQLSTFNRRQTEPREQRVPSMLVWRWPSRVRGR